MRWERMYLNAKLRETADGKKSPGRKGGIFGPGKRWGHTCNSVKGGKFLYVFGGYGKDNCQTNDVYVFDTSRQTWSKPMVKGNPPSPRDSHTCTTVGNNLFVFGGTDGIEPLKDLHIFDTSSNTWISPSLGGEGPDAREGHSAALIGKHLFIFGGCGKSPDNSNEVYYNDLYILDTVNLVEPPDARQQYRCILEGYRQPKGQMLTLVEYMVLLYRAFFPTPVWYRFFLNKEYISLFSSLTTGLYLTFKLTSVVQKVQSFFTALKALSHKEVHYGSYATSDQLLVDTQLFSALSDSRLSFYEHEQF